LTRERKVGHSGTLDPDATGVLLIGIGNATRLLRYLDVMPGGTLESPLTSKAYTAEVVLGTETTTLDASGEVTANHDMSDVMESMTVESVQRVVDAHLTGEIMQVPPMVSALKVDGKRLHELAREGIEVERAARPVTIHRFEVQSIVAEVIRVRVECSSGTYVRTLAQDLGRLLGGGAHVRELRRVSVGAFSVEECVRLDSLTEENVIASFFPVSSCVRSLSNIAPDDDIRSAVAVGRVLPESVFAMAGPPPWVVVEGDRVLAVFEPFANAKVGTGMARPAIVLSEWN
jgi:tRNA pseudouridine55 synthase